MQGERRLAGPRTLVRLYPRNPWNTEQEIVFGIFDHINLMLRGEKGTRAAGLGVTRLQVGVGDIHGEQTVSP